MIAKCGTSHEHSAVLNSLFLFDRRYLQSWFILDLLTRFALAHVRTAITANDVACSLPYPQIFAIFGAEFHGTAALNLPRVLRLFKYVRAFR